MALQLYSDTYWYPSGQLAADVPANIFPASSNVHETLWADAAGTIPLPNPLRTSPTGVLTFYAEAGEHWVHIAGWTFRVPVGMSQEQADLSTGIASGGEFNPSATPGSIDITALVGYVILQQQDGSEPVPVMVKSPDRTEPLVGASLTRVLTWWLMDSTGAIVQQGNAPTPDQRRSLMELGLTAYDGGSLSIVFDQTLPISLIQPLNQMADLMDALGPFSITGNRVSAVPGTLSFNKTAGTLFARAFNFIPDPYNPHVSTIASQTPADFSYNTQATFSEGPTSTFLDPDNYDVGGVVTPVPAGQWTIQRVWAYPLNAISQQVRVQYGQNVFTTQAAAEEAIGNAAFIANPEAVNFSALIAHIVIQQGATDVGNAAQASIRIAGKFDSP